MNNLKTETMQPAGVWSVDRASFPSSLEAQLLLFVYSTMDGGKVNKKRHNFTGLSEYLDLNKVLHPPGGCL